MLYIEKNLGEKEKSFILIKNTRLMYRCTGPVLPLGELGSRLGRHNLGGGIFVN